MLRFAARAAGSRSPYAHVRSEAGDFALKSPRLLMNMAWNVSGALLNALVGFLTLPILVRDLGLEQYGLWSMISAITAYMAALDLGLGAALGRQIGESHSRTDAHDLSHLVWTYTGIFGVLAAVAAAAGLLLAAVVPHTLSLSVSQSADMRTALWIVSGSTALSIATIAPNSLLWGFERFDLINTADNLSSLCRGVAILVMVNSSTTLTDLAWITALSAVAAILLRFYFVVRLAPYVLTSVRFGSFDLFRSISNLGLWYGTLAATRAVVPQLPVFVIGYLLGPRELTLYSVARQLITYSNWLCLAASQVVVARATLFHFGEQHSNQRQLFILANQVSNTLALFFASGVSLFGGPFLHLWQPSLGQNVYLYLMLMMLGEAVAMAQWTSSGIILATGGHRRLAIMGIGEGVLTVLMCGVAAKAFGIWAVCAVLGGLALVRGVLLLQAGLDSVKFSLLDYCKMIFPSLPLLLYSLAAWLLFHAAVTTESWVKFFALCSVYALVFGGVAFASFYLSRAALVAEPGAHE